MSDGGAVPLDPCTMPADSSQLHAQVAFGLGGYDAVHITLTEPARLKHPVRERSSTNLDEGCLPSSPDLPRSIHPCGGYAFPAWVEACLRHLSFNIRLETRHV